MKAEDFLDPFVEPTRVIHEWQAEGEGDEFGWIARNVGDVDGDGTSDLVASAPGWNENAGRIYVYSGKSGELLWQASGEAGDRLGASVDSAGDVDGDGRGDVVAGAPGGEKAIVYAGGHGEVLWTLRGDQEKASYGDRVRGVDDVDGDGHGDVLVGAPSHDVGEGADQLTDAGRAVLYSGADGSVLYEWPGDEVGERLGASLAGGVRGGRIYLILGAPDAGAEDHGRVYVYDSLSDEPHFTIESDEKGSELGGMFLSVVGDVDADGVADVYASDWLHEALGPRTGRIVVHSGVDGRELLKLTGEARGDGFGIGPAQAGDVDGDGHDDLVVGAWQHAGAAPAGGKVYVYSGRDGSLLRSWTCKVMGDTFGFDATGMGDVDGDGEIDFLLTSAWSAVRGAKSGRMFLLAGG